MMVFTKEIGIDLGTANTLVYVKNKGIVLSEPSVVAVEKDTKAVLAVGEEAKEMLGRTPESIVAKRPIRDGVIADFSVTQAMLRFLMSKATGGGFFKPKVIVSIPSGITEVERRAVEEAVMQAGAKEAYLIEEPMAAAIGANLPVEEPIGSLIVNIGGGTSDGAMISLGGIVSSRSNRVAGDAMDQAIIQHLKHKYNTSIGERMAETLKMEIGTAYVTLEDKVADIKGRDLKSGLPRPLTVKSSDIRHALEEPISVVVDAIKYVLERTPPELAADVMQRGITLTGGGSLLSGIDKAISLETGLPVHIAENPLDSVVKGIGMVIEDLASFGSTLTSTRR